MSQGQHNAVLPTATGHRPTSLEALSRHQRISAKCFSPSDEVFELPSLTPNVPSPINIGHKKHGSGIWMPAGYATASRQASRLATKNATTRQLTPSEPSQTLAPMTSRMNVIEWTTASGSKIQAPSSTTTSLLKIQEIQSALDVLQSDFTFPERLDFLDKQLASDSSPLGYLDFTKTNCPIRDHKDALCQLQTDIDSIESYGHEFVRISRRKAVDKIGQALHDLEEKVQRRLDDWKDDRSEEPRIENQKPPLEKPKPTHETRSFLESFHHVHGQPILPTLTPDVCRLVGNDPRFHKVYMEMSSEITKVQMKRIDALSKDHPTDEFDEALMVICQDWELFVHSLIVVKRNEEKAEYAMLEWKSDSDLDLDPGLDCDTHYLSLVLDPSDREKSP